MDETHVAFRARLDNMWNLYMRSRECTTFDQLRDLIVADRLKDSLSPHCLKYCLGVEGHKALSSKDLADLADVFDANYTTDGRYRGGSIQDYKSGKTGPTAGVQKHKKTTFSSGAGQGGSQHEPEGQGQGGQKPKNMSGEGSRGLCWTCESPDHHQRNCPQFIAQGGTAAHKQNGRSYHRKPFQVKACTTVPSKDTDKTVHSSGSTRVESSGHDPVVETAHVKRCVVDDLVNVSTACPVKGIVNTMDDAGSSCLSVEQQPQIIGSDDKGSDAVGPDNGPSLGSVETIDRAGEASGVHISALTHFEISIDGKPEPVMALADSGSQIPVIHQETISQLKAPTLGQIKIQGIFGDL